MRIECKPEGAKYATLNGVEFEHDGTKGEPVWRSGNRNGFDNRITTEILETLGFTFERDLPPVPDGKEYEYKLGKNCSGEKPEGTMWYSTVCTEWSCATGKNWSEDTLYAIPIKKESCVEVLIIPKDRVVNDYADKNGFRFIVVREDK